MTRAASGPGRDRQSIQSLPKTAPLVGVFASLAVLAGCVTGPDTAPPAPAKAAAKPAPIAKAEPAARAWKPQTAAVQPKEPEKIYPPPASLMGLVPGQVTALLGPPPFRRIDEPAEFWQYRNGVCALDLFLYRRPQGGYVVAHFETRPLGAEPVAANDCFRALLKEHDERGAG